MAPIQYVPDRDPIQEALDLKPQSLKCTLTDGSETRVTIWSGNGTNKQFLFHMNKAYSVTKKMGLIPALADAKEAYDAKKAKLKTVLNDLVEQGLRKSEAKRNPRSTKLKIEVVDLKKK